MRLIGFYGIALTLLSVAPPTFADDLKTPATNLVIEKNDIYIPEVREREERHIVLQSLDKKFNYDWNKFNTIANSHQYAKDVDRYIQKLDPQKDLNTEDYPTFANLLHKLGTYQAHVSHTADPAIDKLSSAEPLLSAKEMKAWNYNHLAYAFEKRYVETRLTADKEKSLYYTSKVIDLYPKEENRQVAYAYFIKGLVKHDAQEDDEAEKYFNLSLATYEKIPQGKDDQYTRVKTRLAETKLEQGDQDSEAIALLEQVNQYWQAKGHTEENPFAAKALLLLGQAHLNTGNTKLAQEEINKAINTYQHIYGKDNERLAKAYELLSESYIKAGDQNLAETYQQKAALVNKS